MDAAAASGADSEKRMNLLAVAEEEMIENTGIMPLLFFGFQNIV